MRPLCLIAALLLCSATLVFAATPSAKPAAPMYLTIDHSNAALISAATANGMWQAQLPAELLRVYPSKKWGFVSEVEGGFDDGKLCVITARAMILPRSGKTLRVPARQGGDGLRHPGRCHFQQCQELAKAKLLEAIVAVRSSLLPR